MAHLPELDLAHEAARIAARLREITEQTLRRRGLVVAISGGIDSSVCAALAVRALGEERVFGLLLPERDSSGASTRLGRLLVEHLGIRHELQDISATLEAIGCYARQESVLRRVFPGFRPDWRFKLAISEALAGRLAVTKVVAEDPAGQRYEQRLSSPDYLELVRNAEAMAGARFTVVRDAAALASAPAPLLALLPARRPNARGWGTSSANRCATWATTSSNNWRGSWPATT